MTVTELRKAHPFPWRYATTGPGRIQVFDAAGAEVKLFTILDFTMAVTEKMAETMSAQAT